jgi:hypothetical protein
LEPNIFRATAKNRTKEKKKKKKKKKKEKEKKGEKEQGGPKEKRRPAPGVLVYVRKADAQRSCKGRATAGRL